MTPTPVVLIVFNRPALTRRVVQAVLSATPQHIHVIADGPRPEHVDDQAACDAARSVALSQPWPGEVTTDFAPTNLGLRERVTSGLDKVFAHHERAIIVEDDCVPDPSFFTFCEAVLDHHRNDERVMAVTGDNFQSGRWRGTASYYYSRYPHSWGWATWARAWTAHDPSMEFWPSWRDSADFLTRFDDRVERRYWTDIFNRIDELDSWAYRWTADVFRRDGLVATPNVNLVQNIGFGTGATHTEGFERLGPPARSMLDVTHPSDMHRDHLADRHVFDHHFGGRAMRPVEHPLIWARATIGRLRRRG